MDYFSINSIAKSKLYTTHVIGKYFHEVAQIEMLVKSILINFLFQLYLWFSMSRRSESAASIIPES